jgi:hypothetical protein
MPSTLHLKFQLSAGGRCDEKRWVDSNAGAADGSGYELLPSVANRIQLLDLQSHTVRTPLPVEASSNIV